MRGTQTHSGFIVLEADVYTLAETQTIASNCKANSNTLADELPTPDSRRGSRGPSGLSVGGAPGSRSIRGMSLRATYHPCRSEMPAQAAVRVSAKRMSWVMGS
jgi:hypothetical protein